MNKPVYIYQAEVYRVIDGDTVTLVIDLGFKNFMRVNCRLAGINTAELNDPDPFGKQQARTAKKFLEDLFTTYGQNVIIESYKPYKTDKYGRWLVEIFKDMKDSGLVSVNERLLEEGLAVRYQGT